MTKSDKLLYIALTKLFLKGLFVILTISLICNMFKAYEGATERCLSAGHSEHYCLTGEGPRY